MAKKLSKSNFFGESLGYGELKGLGLFPGEVSPRGTLYEDWSNEGRSIHQGLSLPFNLASAMHAKWGIGSTS
jgi:hypothetical protein